MRIKNSQVVAFLNGVSDIQNKKLPIKVGYAITRNINLMESVAKAYEEERKKVLDKYVQKDGNGEYIVKDGAYKIEDLSIYESEMGELLEIENELAVHTVRFEELEKCDTEQFEALSVRDINLLTFMTAE